jgi:hypothetical protein
MTEQFVSIPPTECISVLNFISKIPKDHKPCYNSLTTISKNAWFTTVRRRLGGEKGEYGVVYVNKILDSCDHHYRMCLNKSEFKSEEEDTFSDLLDLDQDIDLYNLCDILKQSIIGLDNLTDTYLDQPTVSNDYKKCKSKAKTLIGQIEEYLSEGENNPVIVSMIQTNKPENKSFFSSDNIILYKTRRKYK